MESATRVTPQLVQTSNPFISSNTGTKTFSSLSSVLLTSSTNMKTSRKPSISVGKHSTSTFILILTSIQTSILRHSSITQSYMTSGYSKRKEKTSFSEFKTSTNIGKFTASVFSSNNAISSNIEKSKTSFSSALLRTTSSILVGIHATSAFITTITSLLTPSLKYSSNMQSKETARHSQMSSYLQSSMITKKTSATSVSRRSVSIGNLKLSVFSSNKIISSYTASRRTSSFSSALPRLTSYYCSNANSTSSVKSSVSVETQRTSSFITTITLLQADTSKYSSSIQSRETSRHFPVSSYLQPSMIAKKNSEYKGSTSITTRKSSIFVSNNVISSNTIRSKTSSFSSVLPSFTLSYSSNSNIRSSIKPSASVETQAASPFSTAITSIWTSVSKYSSNMQSKETSRHLPMSSYLQSAMITKENSSNSMLRGSTSTDNKIISSYTGSRRTSPFPSALRRLTSSYWSNTNIARSIKSSASVITYTTFGVITTITSLHGVLSKYSSNIQSSKSKNAISSNVARSKTSSFFSVLPLFTSSYWSNGIIRSSKKSSVSVEANATTSSLFTFSLMTIFTSFALTESKYSSIMQGKETSKYSPFTSYLRSSLIMKESTTSFERRKSVSIGNFETSVLASNYFTASNTRTRKTLSLSLVSPSFTSNSRSFANIKSSIKQFGSVLTDKYATFVTTGTLISTTKSEHYMQSKETLIYSRVTAYLDTSREKKEKTAVYESKESRTIWNFETSKLASSNLISTNTASSRVKDKSSIEFTYKMSYISSTFPKNLTTKIKSSLNSVTRISGESMLMASNQTILKTISHSTTQSINNVKSYYDKSLSHIGASSLSLKKSTLITTTGHAKHHTSSLETTVIGKNFLTSYYDTSLSHIGTSTLSLKKVTSITSTGHAKHHTSSLETTVIDKNFSILSKYSFLNLLSVTSTIKSIIQTSILDKMSYATNKLETSIYSSVGLIKMSSEKSSLTILPSASKHKSETFSTHFGLKKTLTSEIFTTSSSYNSALSSIGKTNTPLLETVSTGSFYKKSSTGLRKNSSNILFSITVGNPFSTGKLLYSSSRFSAQSGHYSNYSLLRTSIYYFTSPFESFTKYTSIITVSLKGRLSRLATSPSKLTSIPVINSVSTKIGSTDFSLSVAISERTATYSSVSRSSPMIVVEQSLLSSHMHGSSTSKLTQVVSVIPETKKLASVFIKSSSINFLASATLFLSKMLSSSKLVSSKSYIVLPSNMAISTYPVIVPSPTTITKINSKPNFAKSITVHKNFKQSFATLSAANTEINRTAAKTVLSESYTSIKTHPTTISTLAEILLTTTLIQAGISIEISPTASLSLQTTSSVVSANQCEMQCVIKLNKIVKPNENYIKNVLTQAFKSFRIREYLNISFTSSRDSNSDTIFFTLKFRSETCMGKLRDTVFSKATIFNEEVKFKNIFLSDSFDITPFKPAKEDEIKFKAKIRLISVSFKEDLKNKSSENFKNLEKAVLEALTSLYQKLKGFVEVVNISFEAGSVITNYEIIIDKKESKTKNAKSIEYSIINITQNKLKSGKLGSFNVSGSFNITLIESVIPQKKAKFPGWAIALMVTVILVIIAFILVATQRVSCFFFNQNFVDGFSNV